MEINLKMKIKILISISLIIILGMILSACGGGAGITTSWAGMTVDESRNQVYIAHGTDIYAVNLDNGAEKWRYPEKPDNKTNYYAPPALTDDGQLIAGSYSHMLYSLNPDNGQINQGNWPFAEAKDLYVAGPLASDGVIFAPNNDYNLYAVKTDGTDLWSFSAGQYLWSTPAKDDGTLYLPSLDHYIYAIDAANGEQVWQSEKLNGSMAGSPTLSDDGKLFMGTFGGQMAALDTSNGQIDWSFDADNWVWGGPALKDGVAYFGDMAGTLYAVDASSGQQVWKVSDAGKGGIVGNPVIDGDTIYFTAREGGLYAVNVSDGSLKWNKPVGGILYNTPLLSGDKILVAPVNTEYLAYAFDRDGNITWQYKPERK